MRRPLGTSLAGVMSCLWLALPTVGFSQTSASLEYGVKANYLVRFAAFVDWPANAFVSGTAPMAICVAGRDPFGRALDQAAAGQTAQGRRLVIQRVQTPAAAAGCHILYVAPDAAPAYFAVAPGRLLVTEHGAHGAIMFLVRDARVRFEIDPDAARRSGLAMNSRLLALAVTVRGQ